LKDLLWISRYKRSLPSNKA